MPEDLDRIWKALADDTRRAILDFLRAGPRTTTEIVEQFPEFSRFGVMKHMDVLREASLILTREDGRRRINALNAVPIRLIYERWVSKYQEFWALTLLSVKKAAEATKKSASSSRETQHETATPRRKRKRRLGRARLAAAAK